MIIRPPKVTGEREVAAGLAALDTIPDAIPGILEDAAKAVATAAARTVPTRTGAARGSIRVVGAAQAATVTAGGSKAPYFGWLDYGGNVGRKKSVKRRYLRRGRYLQPAYEQNRTRIDGAVDDGLADAIEARGVEVTRGR